MYGAGTYTMLHILMVRHTDKKKWFQTLFTSSQHGAVSFDSTLPYTLTESESKQKVASAKYDACSAKLLSLGNTRTNALERPILEALVMML